MKKKLYNKNERKKKAERPRKKGGGLHRIERTTVRKGTGGIRFTPGRKFTLITIIIPYALLFILQKSKKKTFFEERKESI